MTEVPRREAARGRRGRGAVGVLLAVTVVACGDGNGDDGAEAGVEAFCEEVSRYDDAGDFSATATAAAYEEMAEVAPEQIRSDVETLLDALDDDVVGDERTAVAGDRFATYVEQACGLSPGSADER